MASAVDIRGPFLVGSITAASLGGAAAALQVSYFHRWPYGKDRKLVFSTVVVLSVLNLVTAATAFWAAWEVATSPMRVVRPKLKHLPLGVSVNGVASNLTALVVQLTYAYRIWRVSDGRRALAGTVLLLALTSFVTGATAAALSLVVPNSKPGSHLSYSVFQIYYARLATAALADAAITAATYYYIRKANRALPPGQRLPALERFLTTTAETNAVTFGLVVATGVVLVATEGYWLVAINETITGVYVISMLVALLSRAHGREVGTPRPEPVALTEVSKTSDATAPTGGLPPMSERPAAHFDPAPTIFGSPNGTEKVVGIVVPDADLAGQLELVSTRTGAMLTQLLVAAPAYCGGFASAWRPSAAAPVVVLRCLSITASLCAPLFRISAKAPLSMAAGMYIVGVLFVLRPIKWSSVARPPNGASQRRR